jgi:glutathione S-transferase
MTEGTIYGAPPSRAGRIAWLATELGLEFEMRPVDIMAGEHKKPEYAAINVLQQVPAFADADAAIGESLAITLYLTQKYKGDVSPRSLGEWAQAYQWTMIAAGIDPQVAPIMTHRIMLPPDRADATAVTKAMKSISKALAGAERHLAAGHEWLMGDRFTVADLNLSAAAWLLHFTGLSKDIGPHFAGWLERCLARPGAQANLKPPRAAPPEMVDRILKMLAEA